MIRILPLIVFSFAAFAFSSTYAQTAAPQAPQIQQNVIEHILALQTHCIPGKWETPACLSAMAVSNKDLAAGYAENVQNKQGKPDADTIIQHCAASTAASQQEVPAYAMASAMTECVNAISDMAESTELTPDPTHISLLLTGILCLNGEPQCAALEQGLKNFK